MNKKGFTLTELLAVIVVIGILLTVIGVSASNIKKDANIREADQIKEMLLKLGPAIYTFEYTSGIKSMNDYCKRTWNGSYKGGNCVIDLNSYIEKRKAKECTVAEGYYSKGICKKTDGNEISLDEKNLNLYEKAAEDYCFNSYKKEKGYITEEAFAEKRYWDNYNYICEIPVDTNKHEKYFYHEYKTEQPIYLSFETLYDANYLNNVTKKGIKNPAGGEVCTGYVSVKKTSSGPNFEVCLNCPGIEGYEAECSISKTAPLLTK